MTWSSLLYTFFLLASASPDALVVDPGVFGPAYRQIKVCSYLVVEEEEATEEAVQVGGEQREVDGGGAGSLDHQRHEAVQAEHEGTESNVQKPCRHPEGEEDVYRGLTSRLTD